MKKLLKRAGVTLLLLVNLFVFLPKTNALPIAVNYDWTVLPSITKDFGELGIATGAICGNPTFIPDCKYGETGWGFFD